MLGFYLFAAVLGGGLLVFSLLGGQDGGGADDLGGHDAPGGHHGAGEMIMGFFRPRNLIFFLATFGATGSVLTWLGGFAPLTLAFAIAMGLGAMTLSHALFAWLNRTDSAAAVLDDADLEGLQGRVVLTLAPGERGRVVCIVGGREQHVIARLASNTAGTLEAGRDVVIVGMKGGVAEVEPFDTLQLPPDSNSTR